MENPSARALNSSVSQGEVLGTVGDTGSTGFFHLHFEVILGNTSSSNWNLTRNNPLTTAYLQGAPTHNSTTYKTFKIVDGPLIVRAQPNNTSTSYGSLANGTTVTIMEIQTGNSGFVYGKIVSGTHNGRWIAIGTMAGEIYAADLTSRWTLVDGGLNVRQTVSTSATGYGSITNGSSFYITEVEKFGDYIFGKIAVSPAPVLASGSTCTVANAQGCWVALSYSDSRYCAT
jgi:murein DD-endopeptidase MepM/ murein hydrolase activator NlpD